MQIIYENHDKKITLEEVAEREFISKYYLSHILKHAVGLGFQEILTLVRIEESEKLLLSANYSIEEVASLCGCSSPLYYSKNFKAYFGSTPSVYREKNRHNTIYSASPAIKVLNSKEGLKKIKLLSQEIHKQRDIDIGNPVRLTIELEGTSNRKNSDKSLKTCLKIKNIKDCYKPFFENLISELCKDLKLVGIAIESSQLKEMHDFFGSWSWSSSLLHLLREKKLVMLFEEQKSTEEESFYLYCLAEGITCEAGTKITSSNLTRDREKEEFRNFMRGFYGTAGFSEIKTATSRYMVLEEDMLFRKVYGNVLRRKEYYKFALLSLMEGEVFYRGKEYIVTRRNGVISIYLQNTELATVKEYIVQLKKIDKNYSVIEYYMYDECEELDLYKMMGSPKVLTHEAVKAMTCTLSPKATFSTIKETFFYDFYMAIPTGGYALLHLTQL